VITADDLLRSPTTDPTAIYRYSVLLMTISEGKCYSETEMGNLRARAGFSNVEYFPTFADRSVITARKR
jgi:hypothetical protein